MNPRESHKFLEYSKIRINGNDIKGDWNIIKGKLTQMWVKLTDDDRLVWIDFAEASIATREGALACPYELGLSLRRKCAPGQKENAR